MIVKDRLRNILTAVKPIYARQCVVEYSSKELITDYLNTHHIQGSCEYSVGLTLTHNNIIVCAMTFGKSRFNKKFQWELLRYCGSGVVGGPSRLFHHFVTQYLPDTIVSYSDNRWFTGKMYDILGFTKESTTVGYQYTDYKQRYDRHKFQKHKLVEQGHDSSSSEWQIMRELGYDRIWDCGQIRWAWNSR